MKRNTVENCIMINIYSYLPGDESRKFKLNHSLFMEEYIYTEIKSICENIF